MPSHTTAQTDVTRLPGLTLPALGLAFALALLFNGPGERLILLAPIVALLLMIVAGKFWQDSRHNASVLPWGGAPLLMSLYLVWLFASPSWSTWPELSGYFAWVLGAMPLTFLLWLWLQPARNDWGHLWWALAAGCAAVGLWGIGEYVISGSRIRGPFLDFNAYGALFNVFFFSALTRYLAQNRTEPSASLKARLHEGLMLVCLAALFATYSRGAIATWGLLVVIALWLAYRHRLLRRTQLIPLTIVTALALAFVAGFKQVEIARPVVNLAADESTQGRVLVWKAAWEIYKDHPWLGVGLGNHKLHYSYYRDPREVMTSGDLTHSDYLQFLEEGGPIQLGFLIALGLFLLSLAYRLLTRIAKLDSGEKRAASLRTAGLLLGVGALFIHATINFIFYILPLSLAAGLFLAQAYRELVATRFKTIALRVSRGWALAAIVFLGGVPVALLSLDGFAAAVFLKQSDLPSIAAIRDDAQRSYALANTLRLIRPRHTIPLTVMAQMTASEASSPNAGPTGLILAEMAKEDYLKLIRIKPANYDAFLGLAELIDAYPHLGLGLPEGMPQDAESLYRLAISYSPAEPRAYLGLAELYDREGRYQEAYDLIALHAARWFRVPAPNAELREELVKKAESMETKLAGEGHASSSNK